MGEFWSCPKVGDPNRSGQYLPCARLIAKRHSQNDDASTKGGDRIVVICLAAVFFIQMDRMAAGIQPQKREGRGAWVRAHAKSDRARGTRSGRRDTPPISGRRRRNSTLGSETSVAETLPSHSTSLGGKEQEGSGLFASAPGWNLV